MPHGPKSLPENGPVGVVTKRSSEFHYRLDALTLEHARHVLYLGETARGRPADNFGKRPGIEAPPESTGRGGIRPCRDQSDNAWPDGRVVVLSSLQGGIDNDGPDVVPTTADFGRVVYAVGVQLRREVGSIIIDSHM